VASGLATGCPDGCDSDAGGVGAAVVRSPQSDAIGHDDLGRDIGERIGDGVVLRTLMVDAWSSHLGLVTATNGWSIARPLLARRRSGSRRGRWATVEWWTQSCSVRLDVALSRPLV
jgi:hypothetical protein